jgi:uncharacterized protein YjbI with pentapeptide repeats
MADGGTQNGSELALPRPKRAFGRSLADLRIEGATTPNGLHPAEERLLDCAARGTECRIASVRPEKATPENTVRGEFLRFLLLGGDEDMPVHEKGVILWGAFIEGSIDLESAKDVHSFSFWRCHIGLLINGRNANFDDITLQECQLGYLIFASASISGDVLLSASRVKGQTNFERSEINGAVLLREGFEAEGEVRFLGAEINGGLNCNGAKLKNAGGRALFCDYAKVTGGVFLCDGFEAKGEVRFLGTEIGGDFACDGGSFKNARAAPSADKSEPPFAEAELNLQGATIKGTLWLGPATPPNHQQVTVEGSINLQGAHASQLVNDRKSWPVAEVTAAGDKLPCYIHLDGFTYDRFAGVTKTDWQTRTDWLKRQRPSHLGKEFRPQPFEQLVKVLREMGHEADARQIAMFKHSLLQKRKKFRMQPFAWIIGVLWGLSCGYGYRPTRLFGALLALWLACGFLYQTGAAHGGFAPKDAQVWTNADYNSACDANWTACGEVKGGKVGEIIAFNPFTYSADMLLPAIDLGQRSAWTPMWRAIKVEVPYAGEVALPAGTLRAGAWAENILGVAGVILIGAILSGIVKRD